VKKAPFEHTPNIEWKNGAWRYRVPSFEAAIYGVTWHKIGTGVADVYEFLAEKARRDVGLSHSIVTINKALDKYVADVLPRKAATTRRINKISIVRIRVAFGKSHPLSVTTPDIFEYRDTVAEANGKKSANNDIEVISHLYSKLIEWGVIENHQHPVRGMAIKFSLPDRDRYVEHWEMIESMKVANATLQIYIPFKLKTGLDKSTILRIEINGKDENGAPIGITPEGIVYKRGKLNRHDSGKKPKRKLIPWDEELRVLADAALSLHKRKGPNLFSTRDGKPYIDEDGDTSGFNSVWQRFMRKVLDETEVIERFTEHDLRAKNASDETDEKVANKRMDHTNQNTTNRVYRRKAEIRESLPLSGIGLENLVAEVEKAKAVRDTKRKTGYNRGRR
jgi:integrase